MNAKITYLGAVILPVMLPPTAWDGLMGGDLIFQEGVGPAAQAMGEATGSRLTNVGIVRMTGGGPWVTEVDINGVYEESVVDFVNRGKDGHYSVYRYDGLSGGDWYHPAVLNAYDYMGYPYDPYYRIETSAFYGSELVYLAFKSAGVVLGKVQTIGDLDLSAPQSHALFLSRWRSDPDCRSRELDRAACWQLIKARDIITPASLAGSPDLKLVFSNFDPLDD